MPAKLDFETFDRLLERACQSLHQAGLSKTNQTTTPYDCIEWHLACEVAFHYQNETTTAWEVARQLHESLTIARDALRDIHESKPDMAAITESIEKYRTHKWEPR